MEDEPHLILNTANGDRRLDRDNSALFTFMGHAASRSHIYVHDDDEEKGLYIFSSADHFDQLATYMRAHDFMQHLNMPEVPDCDEEAYQNMINGTIAAQDIEDFVPDEWT